MWTLRQLWDFSSVKHSFSALSKLWRGYDLKVVNTNSSRQVPTNLPMQNTGFKRFKSRKMAGEDPLPCRSKQARLIGAHCHGSPVCCTEASSFRSHHGVNKVQAKYKLPSSVCARPIWTDTSTKGRRGFSVFTLHSVRINRWRGIFFSVSVLAASSYGSRGLDEIFREQEGMWGHGVHFAPLMGKELQKHGCWCQRGHVVICATQGFLKGAKTCCSCTLYSLNLDNRYVSYNCPGQTPAHNCGVLEF